MIQRVLVTGGAGYIGSHAVRRLLKAGHEVTVLDDLSHGSREAVALAGGGLPRAARFVEGATFERQRVSRLLRDLGIDAVMHFAAFIEVAESVRDPAKYYRNNVIGTLELLEAMREAEVMRLVFSSTAAVYGNPAATPITEDAPLMPINPYGRSKMMVELMIRDFSTAYGLGYAILRYFNVAGASPDGLIGEAHVPETHLIPSVLEALSKGAGPVGVFGTDYPTRDGTCIRDYVHVEDLVEAHLLAMRGIAQGQGKVYNLGSETGFTVREVIESCSRASGKAIPIRDQPRRSGDPAVLIASSARICQELGWIRRYPGLDQILRDAWSWHRNRGSVFRRAA